MMKNLKMTSVASLMMMSAVVPVATTPALADHDHHHHNGGGGAAAGIFLGLTAAAIIANSSHANAEVIAPSD
jgi:hypothetical protein